MEYNVLTTNDLSKRELKRIRRETKIRQMKNNWQLYVMVLLPIIYLIIFKYIPMVGAQIAFKHYQPLKGIFASAWIGFKNFTRFFNSYMFLRLIKNTLGINLYNLILGFPIPIILAISLNYVVSKKFKKTVQMVTYAPHFISVVVLVGIILQFLSMRGIVNHALGFLGIDPINFMGESSYFWSIYVLSNIWQHTGYGSIIYLASLANISPSLHEAAIVDGAKKWQRIWYVDLPGIKPTIIILLILRTGRLMELGFQKLLLMQNPLNTVASEVIQTYVYKIGIAGTTGNFSYPTAIGLFRSVINLILIIAVNRIARKVSRTSLW